MLRIAIIGVLLALAGLAQAMEVELPQADAENAELTDLQGLEPIAPGPENTLDAVPSSGAEMRQKGEVGLASFYSHEFKGRRTASGLRFDPLGMTAAHKTLPLGTSVRITNLENGRTVTATINDRGPYVRGRIVDVSYALAQQLGFVKAGMAKVKIEIMSWEPIRHLRDAVNSLSK